MQTKKKLWLLILCGSLLIGIAAYYYVRLSALSFTCSASVLSEAISPDGKYIATVFERNCGATSPFVRTVTVRSKGTRFQAEDENAWVFVTEDQPKVGITWSDTRQLTIVADGYSHTPGDRRLKTAHWNDVSIIVGAP
jgi:hypothetical protein